MTMQSSGAISIGQARNECYGDIGQCSAGYSYLYELAYRTAYAQQYAWSYWYGQTFLVPINNVRFASALSIVDRTYTLTLNFRTGAISGNSGYSQYYGSISNIASYNGASCSITPTPGQSWRSGCSISQQPAAGNDWTVGVYIDDSGPSGSGYYYIDFYITCAGRFG